MKNRVRAVRLFACGAALASALAGCGKPPAGMEADVVLTLAPPGPTDLGPATGLSEAPADAAVFDLKYRPLTGATDDIPYFSFWGYGGESEEGRTSPFIKDVQKKCSRFSCERNPELKGREWSAVEHDGHQALALYFDLNADGKLQENERIAPTKKSSQGIDFITPDFLKRQNDGSEMLCRVLLQANFYGDSKEPNCMWGPAAQLEGFGTLEGKPARVLLYANQPGGHFDQFGASYYALLLGDKTNVSPGQYVSRSVLSTLAYEEGTFYRLRIEGRRSNSLPARLVVMKDTSPTGTLVIGLSSSNSLRTRLNSVYLDGVDEDTVHFRCSSLSNQVTLPIGKYSVRHGTIGYGVTNSEDWELSFDAGLSGTVKTRELLEITVGQPTLAVRAIEEDHRYHSNAKWGTKFKKGTRIYLEPKITGKEGEILTRFRQPKMGQGSDNYRPPRITIAGPDGKQLLSKVMEYG